MEREGIEKYVSDYVFEDDIFDDEQPRKEVIEKNGYREPIPILENGRGSYGEDRLVGGGDVTNPETCGKRATMKGCLRVDLHNLSTLDGKNFKGKVFVRSIKMSCGKPSCPKCFKSGWAVREAGNIEVRLKESSKRFGQVEHIVLSPPTNDYRLKDRTLRRKVIAILKEIGVVGGCLIFHAFRYKPYKGWYFSPHFHVLGFILGGYRC
jgi:hypothetical protein